VRQDKKNNGERQKGLLVQKALFVVDAMLQSEIFPFLGTSSRKFPMALIVANGQYPVRI